MLMVMGTAAGVSKIRSDDYSRWLSAQEVLTAATQSGAKAFGFEGKLGVLEPGYIADIVGYRLNSIVFSPFSDPVRQLVYAERGTNVDFLMVNGEPLMRDGQLTRVNEGKILSEIADHYNELKDRFDKADRTVARILSGMEHIYRRSLGIAIAPDTFQARLNG
jgi:guanine deaminase